MNNAQSATARSAPRRMPGLWQGVAWAWRRGGEGGGVSRLRLVARTILANLQHGNALHRWMAVVHEMKLRGAIDDLEGEYLRAIRPSVHRFTDVGARVVQLIDHNDWVETAFKPAVLERLYSGKPVTLAELRPPRGYNYMGLQFRRNGVQSPEGELLLTLTLQRSPDVQHKAVPVDVAAIAFSRFRIDGSACLAIGGVRGQRTSQHRVSQTEMAQALQGWQPSVLLVQVMQELARAWNQHLVALHPAAHQLQGWSYRASRRHREAAERIYVSYEALWKHFDAAAGPRGWLKLPQHSDENLAATALSPEKRERQTRRADFWIRTRKMMRKQFRELLMRPGREERSHHVTQAITDHAPLLDEWDELFADDREEDFQVRALQTGPMNLP